MMSSEETKTPSVQYKQLFAVYRLESLDQRLAQSLSRGSCPLVSPTTPCEAPDFLHQRVLGVAVVLEGTM